MSESLKRVIETIDRPVVVIAGPGTGKTEAIIRKVNFLVSKKGLKEESILGITFTDKAASEMRGRALDRFNIDANFMTFHSLAYSELSEFYEKELRILDEPLGVLFIKEFIKNNNLKTVDLSRNIDNVALDAYSYIQKLKEHGILIEDLTSINFSDQFLRDDFVRIFREYENFKSDKGLYDYVDLLIEFRNLLKSNKDFKEKIREKYKYILVDEFQDTNDIQLEILRYIADNNVTIVGDPKQAIYNFRGASVSCFEKFQEFFPNNEMVFLSKTYRLPKSIVDKVNCLIERSDEKLIPLRDGGLVEGIVCQDERSVFELVLRIIKDNPGKSVGVLCRTNGDCELISRYLHKLGVEHFSSSSFLKNNHFVKKLVNFLRIIYYDDNDIECFKLIEDFIKDRSKIKRLLSRLGKGYFNKLREIKEKDYEDLIKLAKEIDRIKKSLPGKGLSDIVYDIVYKLGVLKEAVSVGDKKGISALSYLLDSVDNLSSVFTDSVYFFLNFIEFAREVDVIDTESKDILVEVLTIHKAKGKEFDIVIMPFLNERRFPSILRRNRFDGHFKKDLESHISEEKNLFFVGLTRAKEKLYLSYVNRFRGNVINSKPSRFLKLLDLDFKESSDGISMPNFIDEVIVLLRKGDFEGAIERIKAERSKDVLYFTSDERNKHLLLSPSKIDTYLSCPRKYLYLYEYGIPTPEKFFFAFGKSFHKVLEKLIKEIYETEFGFKEYYMRFVNLLKSYWIDDGYESREQMKEYFEKAIKVADDIIRKELKRKKERKVLKVERSVSLFLPELNVTINGIVDRIDEVNGFLEVIDYKTSKSMKNNEELKEDVQLYIYKNAVEKLFEKKVSKVVLWYVLNDNYVEVSAGEIYEGAVKSKIEKVVKGIREGDFECKPSFMCNFCEFRDICDRDN